MLKSPGVVYMFETGSGSGAAGNATSNPGAGPVPGTGSGGGGGANTGVSSPLAFAETLPEEIRGEAAFRDIKDLGGLAKSYLNATKMIGARPEDVIRLPAADDADGWAAVHARLGRPEAPDKYALTPPKLPDGLTVDDALQGKFAEIAHQAGLTTKQASALYDWYNTETGGRYQAAQQERATQQAQAEQALKTEWGAAYDQNVTLAQKAVTHYGDDTLAQELVATGLGNNPKLVALFAKLGAQLSEDGIIGRGGEGAPGALSPAEAQLQINGLRGDSAFMKDYMNARAPGHKAALEKMQGLYTFAYPATRPDGR